MSRMNELQNEIKKVLKKYEGHSIVPKMKDNECDIIIRMKKEYITKVFIVTTNGISNVVTIPVLHGQNFTIPIATVDGVFNITLNATCMKIRRS